MCLCQINAIVNEMQFKTVLSTCVNMFVMNCICICKAGMNGSFASPLNFCLIASTAFSATQNLMFLQAYTKSKTPWKHSCKIPVPIITVGDKMIVVSYMIVNFLSLSNIYLLVNGIKHLVLLWQNLPSKLASSLSQLMEIKGLVQGNIRLKQSI